MKINNIFYSIQGEGIHIGKPTVIIRFTGCNLRCSYCDTKYAYEEGKELGIVDVLEELEKYKCRNVCITGGEPLLQFEDLMILIHHLLDDGYNITLETNGSIELDRLIQNVNIHNTSIYRKPAPHSNFCVSMDWKLDSSGMRGKMCADNLYLLSKYDQLKFVIGDKEDYDNAKIIVNQITDTHNRLNDDKHSYFPKIIFQFADSGKQYDIYLNSLRNLVEKVLEDELDVIVLPQLHKLLWGSKKGV